MEIVSTMGSGSLGRELDLEAFVSGLENHLNTSVDPNFTSIGMATVRLKEGGPAFTLYRTGTFQIRGTQNEQNLSDAADRFREVLSEMGVEVPNYEFSHVTSVFLEELSQEVNLEALTISLGTEDAEYEPEQFPGLMYRPEEHELTMVVFASGKIIIGGTTDKNEASSAVQRLNLELD
jgi:transcription initiation factor TFIID TATA-box-binding protein